MSNNSLSEHYPHRFVTFTNEVPIDTIIDEVDDSGAITYVGTTEIRAGATSAAVWRIKRIKKAGQVTSIGYANSAIMNQIWDNRASLTYSQGGA